MMLVSLIADDATPGAVAPGAVAPGDILDDLLASRFLSKRWARRVASRSDLPVCLERCAQRLAGGLEWRAYLDDDRLLFAVARLTSAPRRRDLSYDCERGWWLDGLMEPQRVLDRRRLPHHR
jgi:hypothetical protein